MSTENKNNKEILKENENENDEDLMLEDIPSEPLPPDPDECCGSGCIRCVYDIYDIQLDRYYSLVNKIKERNNEKLEKIKLKNKNNSNNIISNNNNNNKENNNNIKEEESTIKIEYKDNDSDNTINNNSSNNNNNNNNIEKLNKNLLSTSIKNSKQIHILENNKDYLFNNLFENCNLKIGKINSYKELSGETSPIKIYHLDIHPIEQPISYYPGDYISILCPQDISLVNKLIKRLNLNSNKEIKIIISSSNNNNYNNNNCNKTNKFNHLPNQKYCKIIDIFTWCINLSFIPPQFFLRVMSDYCTQEDEKKKLVYLSSPQGQSLYNETIVSHQINWVSLLCKFKSCNLPLDVIFINIPPHETRKYSISSSPLSTNNIHITFNLVKISSSSSSSSSQSRAKETTTKDKFGICTHWMHNQIELFKKLMNDNGNNTMTAKSTPSIYLPFTIESSNNFNLPNDLSTPIILIATGTGIAPFRSFLQHRYYQIQDSKLIHQSSESIGKCLFFFGCRKKDWDNLYNDELLNFEKDLVISNLFITFSQEHQQSHHQQQDNSNSNQKIYINKLIEENGELIFNLIDKENAIIYVCGNKNKIGRSINDSLIEIIKKYNKYNIKSNQEAQELLKNWINLNKYKRDVWS